MEIKKKMTIVTICLEGILVSSCVAAMEFVWLIKN